MADNYQTGGPVKSNEIYRLGDDAAPSKLFIEPVWTDLSVREIEKMVRYSLKKWIKLQEKGLL